MHVFCDISENKEETTSDSKRKETTLDECMNSDLHRSPEDYVAAIVAILKVSYKK